MTDLTNPIFTDETAARLHLERIRWPNGVVSCPYCGVVGNAKALGGKSMGDGWYHCPDCRKKFTVRVGSVYERSHIPLHKWVLATHLLCASKKGMSAHQLHRMLGVTYKSAWFMAHRIRESMIEAPTGPLGGGGKIVEADETFIGQNRDTYSNEKGWQKQRSGAGMKKIVSLVERGGKARSIKVENLRYNEIKELLVKNLAQDSTLMTDEARHYIHAGKHFEKHETILHSKKEYARGKVSTNTVEGFFSIFKRGMKGVYQQCGEQHLHRYLVEFDFRYNNRIALEISDNERRDLALLGSQGKRLTYRRTNGAAA
ncbi:IS1595 family transposase [Ferrovibrio sp. MS7]|uniref:IS1595 family transposase n=1 Tax=Ferrovibrio plantarum TaxID=3119164 RepID=UPI0031351789